MSSMLFGFLYDSFFGYEHVISNLIGSIFGYGLANAFFIRPIENINTILIMSIIIGIFLLLVSFGYSIVNKLKKKDIKEGLLGRNGIAGLCLYLSFDRIWCKCLCTHCSDTVYNSQVGYICHYSCHHF